MSKENQITGLNSEKNKAIWNILKRATYPAPYVVYGPPGTGKTTTIVEAICQIRRDDPSNKIWICTPSNSAADEIVDRLINRLPSDDMIGYIAQADR